MNNLNLIMWVLAGMMAISGFAILSQAGKGGNPAMPELARAMLTRSQILWGGGMLVLATGVVVRQVTSGWGLGFYAVALLLFIGSLWGVLSARKASAAAGIPWVSRISVISTKLSQ